MIELFGFIEDDIVILSALKKINFQPKFHNGEDISEWGGENASTIFSTILQSMDRNLETSLTEWKYCTVLSNAKMLQKERNDCAHDCD